MNRYLPYLLIVLLSFSGGTSLFAQVKYEREFRAHPDEIPEAARAFVSACSFSGKIKWYREESSAGSSVEAKTKQQGIRYSIEFDTSGKLQDVETERTWGFLPPASRDAILSYLDSTFTKFKFIKIQLQWTGDPSDLERLIRGEVPSAEYVSKYEIVLKGRDPTGVHWYECLFTDQGLLEHKSRIVFRNTDNLDY